MGRTTRILRDRIRFRSESNLNWDAMFSRGISPLPNSAVVYMFEKYTSLEDTTIRLQPRTWWAHVTVAPLDSKITVFSKGSSKGFTGSIPIGGHWAPNSTVGVSALWKNAQNIATKNKASVTIKRITPKFSPFWTARVWSPK